MATIPSSNVRACSRSRWQHRGARTRVTRDVIAIRARTVRRPSDTSVGSPSY